MQKFTSKNTSINQFKLPSIYKKVNLNEQIVLDIGCGKYTDHIKEYVHNNRGYYWGYDPYNIPEKKNIKTLNFIITFKASTIIISSVLNVIQEKEERIKLVNLATKCLLENGTIYISVYAGDKTGIGKQTKKDCWQNNQKIDFYIDELRKSFSTYEIKKVKGMIVINRR